MFLLTNTHSLSGQTEAGLPVKNVLELQRANTGHLTAASPFYLYTGALKDILTALYLLSIYYAFIFSYQHL